MVENFVASQNIWAFWQEIFFNRRYIEREKNGKWKKIHMKFCLGNLLNEDTAVYKQECYYFRSMWE